MRSISRTLWKAVALKELDLDAVANANIKNQLVVMFSFPKGSIVSVMTSFCSHGWMLRARAAATSVEQSQRARAWAGGEAGSEQWKRKEEKLSLCSC